METVSSILSGAGALLLGSLAFSMWYGGGNKSIAVWVGFAGAVCFVLIGAIQMQDYVWKIEAPKPGPDEAEIKRLRAHIGFPLFAIILNSPAPGSVTAWVRMQNSGLTPAYKFQAWHRFNRGPSGQDPFDGVGEFQNEMVLAPGGIVNMNSKLPLDAGQLDAIKATAASFYLWGRVEFVDDFGQSRHIAFKGVMNGPPATIVVEGTRAEGWGFQPTKDGWDQN